MSHEIILEDSCAKKQQTDVSWKALGLIINVEQWEESLEVTHNSFNSLEPQSFNGVILPL